MYLIRSFSYKYFISNFLGLFFFLFCAGNISTTAQPTKVKETYEEGEDFFKSEDYKEAIYYFLKVVNEGFVSANLQYKIGVCYLNIPGDETKAVTYLEEASQHITTKYKNDISEREAPLHTLFYLGNAYRIDNQLSKALESYDKFVNSPGYDGNYNYDIVETEIKACERAKIIQDSPVEVSWDRLPDYLNTSMDDTKPAVSGDGNILVYLTPLKFYKAIYFTRKVQGNWLPIENINPQILSDGEFYPTALSFDGKELYLVKEGKSNMDLYVSYFKDMKWTPAKPLRGINTDQDESSASISSDGKLLYFSSNRGGGKGGFDIYVSEKNINGEWGKPTNLGKIINTKQDDVSPSISEDGKTLYFSSKGHYNMGGFDIFYSEVKNNKWDLPVNIGYPINTTNDNIDFKVIGNTKTGYLSKKMDKNSGSADIYFIDIKSKFTAPAQDDDKKQ
jgi:Tol biopolymer transport system component